MLRKYMEQQKKTIIFVSDEHKTYVERCLLKIKPAYFHIQVTTPQRYILDLLKKNHLFDVELLSKKTSLLALKKSLEIEGLTYFKNIVLTEGFVNALLEAYEMMADIDVSQLPTSGKWNDLKRMYQVFCNAKGNEYFFSELVYKAIPFIEKEVCYVDLSYSNYSLALDTFFKKCHVEEVELNDLGGRKDFNQVQFSHQEIDLAISQISDGLKSGKHYKDFLVYVPNSQWINDFISKCPYPCKQQLSVVNNRDDAFLDAFYIFDEDKMKKLAYLEDRWLQEMKEGTNQRRKELLEEIVSYTFEDLPEDLDFETYRLFTKLLYVKPSNEVDPTLDCINVVTYQTPITCECFSHVFCLGLNEDIYPSKISESALILNDEIIPCYPEGTPLLRNATLEWERVYDILKTSSYYTISCHFGALDGSEVLPSLLYKQLKGNQKEKKTTFFFPTELDEISLSFDGQVKPLNNAKDVYRKKGISPSELETFNACPYKHFLSYGLKIRPRRRKLETRAKFGTLMHDMLDYVASLFSGDFFEALIKLEEEYHLNSQLTLNERLKNLLDAFLKNYMIELEGEEEYYLYKQFPTQFLNTLKILLYHIESGEFRMAFHEEKFMYEKDGVSYLGRIDRADVYKDYIKIMDYKSSNKTLDLALALEGFNVQMAMYLEMLAQNKQMKKGALLYFNTCQRKIDANGNMNLDGTTSQDFEAAYKMEGWILEDSKHEVMYGIDHNFPDSQIAHMRYVKSKDGYTGHLLKDDQLDVFISKIFAYLHQLVERCFNDGDISISPAGSDDLETHMKVSPCQYCDYQDVCLRDPFYHENRQIKVLKKDELEKLLEGGNEDGQSDINE